MAQAPGIDDDETVDRLARAGFAAKGMLYGVLGVLAFGLGLSGGGGEASQQGAISSLADQPFGGVLVGLLAAGLTGYAIFRAVQVVRGDAASFSSLPDWLARITFAVRAVIYAGLATSPGASCSVAGAGAAVATPSRARRPRCWTCRGDAGSCSAWRRSFWSSASNRSTRAGPAASATTSSSAVSAVVPATGSN